MKKILMLMASVALLATACSKSDDNGGDNNGGDGNKLAKPASFTTTVSTTSSLTVTWGAVTNATGYTYKLGQSGIETSTSQTTASFSGLEEDTAYTVYVKATANGYEDSDWATYTAYTAEPSKGNDDLSHLPESLRGTNYYLIQTDQETADDLAGRIAADIRGAAVDFWSYRDDVYKGGEPEGSNWRGRSGEGWLHTDLGNAMGWFGIGWRVVEDDNPINSIEDLANKILKMREIDDTYVFHCAMKAQHNGWYALKLSDCSVEIGSGSTMKYDFERDGAWHEINIPITEFFNAGLSYSNVTYSTIGNPFAITQAGGENIIFPTSLDIDAVFIYKPANN